MKRLIAACAAGFVLVSGATAEDMSSAEIVSVAEHYLDAYSTYDVAGMAPYLADDMVFIDPTSTNQNAEGGPFDFEGKAAVLKGLGDYAAQYKSFKLDYDVERRFESNGVVVFVADVSYVAVARDDNTYTGSVPVVTAITVRDGKVVKHLDLYDYKGNAVDPAD